LGKLEGNTLFPVFLKLQDLRTVVIGAGAVGHEKLSALLLNSPEANITVIAEEVSPEVSALVLAFPKVKIFKKKYEMTDLISASIVIAATNRSDVNASRNFVISIWVPLCGRGT
jgi:siroheme synthase-like protein